MAYRPTVETLFQARFEPPAYVEGLLVPQQGWFADMGEEACKIAPSSSLDWSAKIEGSLLGDKKVGSYGCGVTYDPLKRGDNPMVRMSGYLKYSAPHAVCVAFGLCAPLTGENQGHGEPVVPNALIGIWEEDSKLVPFLSNWDGESVSGKDYTIGEWIHLEAVFNFANRTIRGYGNNELIGEIPFTKNIVPIVSFVAMTLVSDAANLDGVAYFDNLLVTADKKINSGCLGLSNFFECFTSSKVTIGNHVAPLQIEQFPLS